MIRDIPYPDLQVVKDLVYDKCNFVMTNLKPHTESVEYAACSFQLNDWKIEHRLSKITPTKTGQFVTVWKRNENGITEPFSIQDDIDFIVITSGSEKRIGQFIFPKSVLAAKGIITSHGKQGKRGVRVYPPWDIVTNKQAEKTQSWQINYFVTIENTHAAYLELARKLFETGTPDI